MKKIILAAILAVVLSFCAIAQQQNDDILDIDFTASYSEDESDMLGVQVKDGFNVCVLKGKLSTISTFGIPVSFVLENDTVKEYDYAVFMLKSAYVDENSVLTMKYKFDDGSVIQENHVLPDNKFNFYCVKIPDGNVSGFEIFVNSVEPTADMYAVDLDYIKLYKSKMPVLLMIDSVRAYVASEMKTLDSPAVIRDNFTLTPARFVAESVGAKVDWIGAERKVLITKDDTTIELVIDKKTAKVNDEEVELDVPPCIINDFTYTPARFVAEKLGCSVQWDSENKVVTVVTTDKEYVNPEIEEYLNASKEYVESEDEEMSLSVYVKGNSIVYDCIIKTVDSADVTDEVKATVAEMLDTIFDGTFELMKKECPAVESVIVNYFDKDGNIIITREFDGTSEETDFEYTPVVVFDDVESYLEANKENLKHEDEIMSVNVYAIDNSIVYECVLKTIVAEYVDEEVAEELKVYLSNFSALYEIIKKECPVVESVIVNYFDKDGEVIVSYEFNGMSETTSNPVHPVQNT